MICPRVSFYMFVLAFSVGTSVRHESSDPQTDDGDEFTTTTSSSSSKIRKTIVFVRHGQSINNILSQDWRVDRFILHGGSFRDSKLSRQGKSEAEDVSRVLFTENRVDDQYHLFDGRGNATFQAVYTSPLRRAILTAVLLFGNVAHVKGIPFKILPRAHEQRHSISDVGEVASVLHEYSTRKMSKLFTVDANKEPAKSLLGSLDRLPEEWSENPSIPDADLPYYPPGHGSYRPTPESDSFMSQRMERLQQELCRIPEDAVFVVAHSGVMRRLFKKFFQGRKPDNIAMVYGELTENGWENVQMFADKAQVKGPTLTVTDGIAGIPTYMNKKDSCITDNQYDFLTANVNGRFAANLCCSFSPKRRWCAMILNCSLLVLLLGVVVLLSRFVILRLKAVYAPANDSVLLSAGREA